MAAKTRVLIVDNHPFTREGIRFYLQDTPQFEVVGEAGDGPEAVEKALELQPNVVVIDLELPVFDGLEATRRLRAILPATRVLILSLEKGRYLASRARQAGALGWVSKVSSPAEFIRALETVSQGESLPQ